MSIYFAANALTEYDCQCEIREIVVSELLSTAIAVNVTHVQGDEMPVQHLLRYGTTNNTRIKIA